MIRHFQVDRVQKVLRVSQDAKEPGPHKDRLGLPVTQGIQAQPGIQDRLDYPANPEVVVVQASCMSVVFGDWFVTRLGGIVCYKSCRTVS